MTVLRRLTASLAAVAMTLGLSACDFDGAYDLPLPGSPVDHDDTFEITADFRDVLNVVPRSPVQVSDVTVGEVTEVERVGWHAKVTMVVRKDVRLPDNTVAAIRQTSLLGEKYVDLSAPAAGATGRLGEGDALPLSATGRNPEVEEVLGALSFLLSGGGLGQIKTISTELNKVMTGRTDRLRHLLGELDTLVGTLDGQKDDIIAAMEAINSLTRSLNKEKRTIQAALDATGPALKVLNKQHRQLMRMLGELDKLGRVGTRVINATQQSIVDDLAYLEPILTKLNEAGDSLPRGLSLLISFPFPQEAADIAMGDYANTAFALKVDLSTMLPVPTLPLPTVTLPSLPTLIPTLPTPTLSLPTILPSLPTTLPSLPTSLPSGLPSGLPTALPTLLRQPGDGGAPSRPLRRYGSAAGYDGLADHLQSSEGGGLLAAGLGQEPTR